MSRTIRYTARLVVALLAFGLCLAARAAEQEAKRTKPPDVTLKMTEAEKKTWEKMREEDLQQRRKEIEEYNKKLNAYHLSWRGTRLEPTAGADNRVELARQKEIADIFRKADLTCPLRNKAFAPIGKMAYIVGWYGKIESVTEEKGVTKIVLTLKPTAFVELEGEPMLRHTLVTHQSRETWTLDAKGHLTCKRLSLEADPPSPLIKPNTPPSLMWF